jgi:hypothetical protein
LQQQRIGDVPVGNAPGRSHSLGTPTGSGYGNYGIDVDAVITPFVISSTMITCTIIDSSGTRTTAPLPTGPEDGVPRIGETGVVKTTGIIKGGPESPLVTPVVDGADSYTNSYNFVESR